jgi:PleD family two-component response regulator/EAL domain-containing protein (putative c-di-GMP-specific phosphodiesterase class I)
MHAQADTQRAELRLAFLRHLPKRAEAIGRRGRRLCRDGWDINGLSLLHEDVQKLAGVSGRYGVLEVSEQLLALEELLGQFLGNETLPDGDDSERIEKMLAELAPSLPPIPSSSEIASAAQVRRLDSSRAEVAPPHYWRRWVEDAAPPRFGPVPAPEPETAQAELPPAPQPVVPPPKAVSRPARPATMPASEPEPVPPPRPEPEPLPALPVLPVPAVATRFAPITKVALPVAAPALPQRPHHRLYHLTDASPLSVELDQRLEALGYELELIDSSEELKELLGALGPDAVIVDAAFANELEGVGVALRSARERSGARVALLVLASEDTVPVRLAARRAGANALLIRPRDVEEVVAKLQGLLAGGAEDEKFRILVVEDDRSQALFAESILRNAGMEALVVTEAFDVLDALQRFKPDLVLMDLYMPQCDGTELTALIREREEFLNTPIVFLSGESDQDKHYEALSVGGDDFLSKPIRPKYLIASVTNRVQRARALRQRSAPPLPRDPGTGLHHRAFLLDRLNEALSSDTSRGGVLFLEIDGVLALRERLGLSGVEQLLAEAATYLVQRLDEGEIASRYSDGCLVVFSPDNDELALESRAIQLRRQLAERGFQVAGQPQRIRLSVGVCALRHGFGDAGALLNAAERASRSARGQERGVFRFEPPKRVEDEIAASLTLSIREAVEHDGFELLYQPIVALQGSEDAQYQTLLRLRDDAGKLHTAAEIVPLAQRAGQMLAVDRWVLTQAMRVLEQRRSEHRPVKLFVNQAASSLLSPGQADWLIAQLQTRRLDGSALTLELALDDVSSRTEPVQDFCESLQAAGVQFCLSRFEAGLEGDSVLDQLPVTCIKLAPRYLSAAHTPSLRDELRQIVERAHRRGLLVVAPRVEDAQAASVLWMSGIDLIQGNLVQLAGSELDFDFQAAVL